MEMLLQTAMYQEDYLRAYTDCLEAEVSLARFLRLDCRVRLKRYLGGRTPREVYN